MTNNHVIKRIFDFCSISFLSFIYELPMGRRKFKPVETVKVDEAGRFHSKE